MKKTNSKIYGVSLKCLCLIFLTLPNSSSGVFAGNKSHLISMPASFQQQKRIQGTVRDEMGKPLSGATIRTKLTKNAVSSTADGSFEIEVAKNGDWISVHMLGYQTAEIQVSDQTEINITLKTTSTSLDAVVVVGYGTQKRDQITTSVASVKAEDFIKGAVQDPAQLIRGKVAGLNIVTPDANPVGNSQINLRGITTLTAGTSPLVIIDGVPGSLQSVAPQDIESIDVLKDGGAAAIYGTRGTNGVILITTRKPDGNLEPSIMINSYISSQQINRRLDFLSPEGYRELVAQKKAGAYDYGHSTNWLDEISRNAISQVHNLSISGGSKNTSYLANLNLRDDQGIILKSDNQRIIPRVEVSHQMFDGKLKLTANLTGSQQKYFAGADGSSYRGDVYRNAITYNPTDPLKDEDGNWTEHTDKTNYANPLALLMETKGKNQNTTLRSLGSINYRPIQGLDIMAMGSREIFNSVRGYYETKNHYSTRRDSKNGFASRGTTRREESLMELTANYQRNFGNHDLKGLLGYSWRETNHEDYWMQNWDFPSDDFSYNNIGAGLALSRGEAPQNSYQSSNRLIGYFFRLNYAYKNRYLLMASIRREGSSKFGKNNKYGNFPAISAGWNIKNEGFLMDNQVLSTLKLRASFGITGTEPETPYLSLNRLNFDSNALLNGVWSQVVNVSSNANPNLRWERKQETNLGVDFGFWNNRLTGSIDLYQRKTNDLLFDYSVPTPPYLYNRIRANAASMENKGVEVQLNYSPIMHEKFQWNSSVNYSTNRNKLLSLSDKSFQLAAGYFDAGTTEEPIQQPLTRIQIGQPIGNFYGYKSVDIDENGYWIIEGKDGKPKPIADQKAEDKQIIGNGLPKHYLNFNNNFKYGNFDLGISMRGAFGFDILNLPQMFYSAPVMLTRGNILANSYDKIYGKRPLADDQSLNYLSYYIEKGDYWKIDNVTLGYRLNFNQSKIKSMRLYLSGSNLVTITNYSGIDPETPIVGLTPGVDERDRYPSSRTFTLGASLTF